MKDSLAGRQAHAALKSFSFLCALVVGSAPGADARSLSEQIDTLFGANGIVLDVNPSDPSFEHTAHFTSSTLSTLGLLVGQLAPSAADFPAISTVPGFSYRYNPELDEFERTSTSMGPIFVERPRTIGEGNFDVGLSYSYIKFDELDGANLAGLELILEHGESAVFGAETATVTFQKFDLSSHVVSFFATYGITDRWDVNFLLPVVRTSMDVRANVRLDNVVDEVTDSMGNTIPGPFHFFDEALRIEERTFSAKDDATGVGDLLLRTKYHLVEGERINVAPGLVLRVPTGAEEDFQGLGDTTLNLFVAASGEHSVFHFHASLGFDVNLNHSDRSRVRYAGGVTVQLLEPFAFTADIIGSSNLTSYSVAVSVPEFDNAAFDTDPPTPSGFATASQTLRTDIVDISLGFKLALSESVVGFANVLVPLNDDGLRAKAIPTAGIEVSF